MKTKFNGKGDFLKMLRKYLNGNASPAERAFLDQFYANQEKEHPVLDQYSEAEKAALEEDMEEYILARTVNVRKRPFHNLLNSSWRRFAAAASILLAIISGLFYFYKNTPKPALVISPAPKDFAPGTQRAVLTLANGSEVALDNAENGLIATEGNATITKNSDGKLSYQVSGDRAAAIGMNMVATPAGGQYTIVLPDGSQAWLNARSSISFPTTFAQSERKISIKGECYFEIKTDKTRPFVVDVNGKQQIVVTGTHFNVNAYDNESEIRTTLLEGAVYVTSKKTKGGQTALQLLPGEQSVFNADGQFQKSQVDVNEVVAWKSGFFQFHETPLTTIMRDIERWYNVEVEYAQGIPKKRFSGKLRRDSNASGILEILRFAGVNFRLEASSTTGIQGKIVVLPVQK
jgi:transmembrane sensor